MSVMASQITSLTIVYTTAYSKLRVTGLCEGNSPGTGEFPAQRARNAEMFPFDDVIMKQDGCFPKCPTKRLAVSYEICV